MGDLLDVIGAGMEFIGAVFGLLSLVFRSGCGSHGARVAKTISSVARSVARFGTKYVWVLTVVAAGPLTLAAYRMFRAENPSLLLGIAGVLPLWIITLRLVEWLFEYPALRRPLPFPRQTSEERVEALKQRVDAIRVGELGMPVAQRAANSFGTFIEAHFDAVLTWATATFALGAGFQFVALLIR
ncbi:MAG: hypothetical protein GEU80_17080 [Dehalococcoidia bacterium]|nr:hypothetical protein [Dehalococcoidia bacterium]